MAATFRVLGASVILLCLLQSAVVVRAELCSGGVYCSTGYCCGTYGTSCCSYSSTHTSYSYSIPGGIIAAIVIGCLLFIGSIIGCIACCVCCCCRTRTPAPIVYTQPGGPSATVVNSSAMPPGTAYAYPQAQQYPMSPTNYPQGAPPYTPQQPAQYNPAFSPEHGQQPPDYTPNKY